MQPAAHDLGKWGTCTLEPIGRGKEGWGTSSLVVNKSVGFIAYYTETAEKKWTEFSRNVYHIAVYGVLFSTDTARNSGRLREFVLCFMESDAHRLGMIQTRASSTVRSLDSTCS